MGPVGWAIAIIILQAVIGALAKKAQAKRTLEARRNASATGATASSAPSPQAKPTVRVQTQPPRRADAALGPQRVVVRPSADSATRPMPPMQQRGAAPRDPAVAMARAIEEARTAAEARAAREARAIERARAESSQRNRSVVNSTRGQVRTVQPSKDRFSVKGKAGQTGARPPVPPAAEREEYAALQSSKRVRESLEKVRAAERRVGGGRVAVALGPTSGGADGRASPRAAALRKLLASPERTREGILVSELLGPPRSMRPLGLV
jgi:hypothetical protein